jgi:hypothetical protein
LPQQPYKAFILFIVSHFAKLLLAFMRFCIHVLNKSSFAWHATASTNKQGFTTCCCRCCPYCSPAATAGRRNTAAAAAVSTLSLVLPLRCSRRQAHLLLWMQALWGMVSGKAVEFKALSCKHLTHSSSRIYKVLGIHAACCGSCVCECNCVCMHRAHTGRRQACHCTCCAFADCV